MVLPVMLQVVESVVPAAIKAEGAEAGPMIVEIAQVRPNPIAKLRKRGSRVMWSLLHLAAGFR